MSDWLIGYEYTEYSRVFPDVHRSTYRCVKNCVVRNRIRNLTNRDPSYDVRKTFLRVLPELSRLRTEFVKNDAEFNSGKFWNYSLGQFLIV